MEREQEELQSLGLFGIYREACMIIFKWRRIFSQITLSLVLPLSVIFLAHIESNVLLSRIFNMEFVIHSTRADNPIHKRFYHRVSSEWAYFWLFKFVYFTFLLIFSLLSTAAVVYTIACVYTAREATFKKVMRVVPKVWKRLMVTFLWTFLVFLVYNLVAVLIFFIWAVTDGDNTVSVVFFFIILICYAVGFVYLTVLWQLASVVSVLEDKYGFKAMLKSKELIKGKMWVAIVFFFKLNFSLYATQYVFQYFVVSAWPLRFEYRIGVGLLCFLLLLMLILFGLVIQTIIYFVCKSYHQESIDKSALSEHLEVLLGEYERLKPQDIQLKESEWHTSKIRATFASSGSQLAFSVKKAITKNST
ncbi:unnamed protein product [Ilex paraguariensis]|uniref:Uncharacterized protein n=1 Tax=Ilex paraguariensis TaxID=185542 RepID=A0ABC8SKG3_9AQUA